MRTSTLFALFTQLVAVAAFSPSVSTKSASTCAVAPSSTTALPMASKNNDEDFMRWAKQARYATEEDTVVELPRPLGLVLNQDEQGNVYVETVAPKGNAARTGKVKEGDLVTMVSATFGDEMWSCRGVGLTRTLAAIRVRAGPVRLVFESPNKYSKKKSMTTQQIKAKQEAAEAAQRKKDQLLEELETDEKRLNKKWFGLF